MPILNLGGLHREDCDLRVCRDPELTLQFDPGTETSDSMQGNQTLSHVDTSAHPGRDTDAGYLDK